MLAVLQLIVIAAISAAFVRKVLGKRGPEFESSAERLVFECSIGLGMLGLLIFALGALQLFYMPVLLVLVVAMAVFAWRELSGIFSDITRGLRRFRQVKWTARTLLVSGILGAIGLLVLVRSLAPPIADDWDSLAYHLAVPKLFLEHHGIHYIPFASHSNFPFTWEMLYVLGLAFGSISLAKLFHFAAGALLVGAVYCAGRRHFGPRAGSLAALILAGIPLVGWEATAAYVDLATALFSFLAVYSLLNYSEARDRRWAALAGITAGLAAGTKMTALAMLAVVIVWILWPASGINYRGRLRTAAVSAGLALIFAAPWYVKSWIYTGNPVYPFFYSLFGGHNWSERAAELYRADQLCFGLGRDLPSLLMLPWNLTFRFARFCDYGARLSPGVEELPLFSGNTLAYLASLGPVFLAALPFTAAAMLKPGKHRPFLLVSTGLALMWFFMMQNTRYLIPALALLAPVVAYSAAAAGARRLMMGIAGAAGVFTVILLAIFVSPVVPVVLGIEDSEAYLRQNLGLYRASEFVNNELPKDASIALFGETRGFYLDRDYFWADPAHNALIPFDRAGSDPSLLLDWLRSHGIEYVLINHSILPVSGEHTPGSASIINEAIGEGLEMLYSSGDGPGDGVSVYRIVTTR